MTIYKIQIDETGDKTISEVIQTGIVDFNMPYFGCSPPKPFALYIKDKESAIIAGITGFYGKSSVQVDLMWVRENYRRQGIGRKLLHKLEFYALGKHCQIINLDTFDFQAKPFYEKHGYECIGTIPKFYKTIGKNIDRHFMRKVL